MVLDEKHDPRGVDKAVSLNYFIVVIVLTGLFALGIFLFLNQKAFSTKARISAILAAEDTTKTSLEGMLRGYVVDNRWLELLIISDQRPAMAVKLRRLGYRSRFALRYLGLVKLALGLSFGLVGVVILAFGVDLGILVALVGLVLGIYLPDIVIDRRIEAQDKQISRDIPDFTDLLNICIRSGMTLSLAIDRVAKGIDRSIRIDLLTISERARMGDSVEDSIESLSEAKEISQPTANALGSIARATQLGIPIGDVIQQSADDLRKRRVDETKAEAAKLPVKILIPLMVCLLPSVMIVVLGPAILGMVEGFAALGG